MGRFRCGRSGEVFSHDFFISGPGYEVCLVNFLLGSAKMDVWRTQKNEILGVDSNDSVNIFKGMWQAVLKYKTYI